MSETHKPAYWSKKLMGPILGFSISFFQTFGDAQPAFGLPSAVSHQNICDRAAAYAAQRHSVPLGVLRAITRVETGRASTTQGIQPWAWTVNMEGAGHWFGTRDEAVSFVFRNYKSGARSFDVGCFQINYRWHGDAFNSIDHMFEPQANAEYAAVFLKSLYAEFGNWKDAVGAYHSRSDEFASSYKARFERIYRDLSPNDESEQMALQTSGDFDPQQIGSSPNAARPLVERGSVRLGSLVPVQSRANPRPALIDFQ